MSIACDGANSKEWRDVTCQHVTMSIQHSPHPLCSALLPTLFHTRKPLSSTILAHSAHAHHSLCSTFSLSLPVTMTRSAFDTSTPVSVAFHRAGDSRRSHSACRLRIPLDHTCLPSTKCGRSRSPVQLDPSQYLMSRALFNVWNSL